MNYKTIGDELAVTTNWLLPLRLVIFVLLFAIILGSLKTPPALTTPLVGYGFCTLGFLIVFALRKRWILPGLLRFFFALQIIWEIFMEAGIIHYSGTWASPFSALFLLSIVSASLVYRLAGTLTVATFASLFYAFVVWGSPLTVIKRPWEFSLFEEFYSANDETFSTIFLHFCIFYLTAFISGYLAERLKRKSEELATASEQLEQQKLDTDDILEHMYSGLLTVDNTGRMVYFNRAAEEIFEYTSDEIQGKHFREIFGNRVAELAEKIEQVLASGQTQHRFELAVIDKNGRKIPVGFTLSRLEDNQGCPRGVIGVFQDLTETKLLEERIRTADRLAAVGELSAGIAHEIRNPLASISGSVEVLKKELAAGLINRLSADEQKLLDLILTESARLNRIVTDFLQFARTQPTLLTRVNLIRLVEESLAVVKRHPQLRSDIQVIKFFDPEAKWVWGEEHQIKQVLINLLVNAWEAMESTGGQVTITISNSDSVNSRNSPVPPRSDWIVVCIKDEGKGIPAEQKNRVFQPFFSTKSTGTGLGLAIVQRLVSNLHGRLEFKSEVNKGSEFLVYFQSYQEKLALKSGESDSVTVTSPDLKLAKAAT